MSIAPVAQAESCAGCDFYDQRSDIQAAAITRTIDKENNLNPIIKKIDGENISSTKTPTTNAVNGTHPELMNLPPGQGDGNLLAPQK